MAERSLRPDERFLMSVVAPTPSADAVPTNGPSQADEVKQQALSGVKALGVRTIYSLGLRVIQSLALARLLTEHDYGTFGVATYISSLGTYFSNGGFGGGLIQREEPPTPREMFTLFAVQQAIILVFILIVMAFMPAITQLYKLDAQGVTITVVMTWSMLLCTLRLVPMLKLERDLSFREIARIELMENSVRTILTVALAFFHLGAWSLTIGQIVGLVVLLGASWVISGWKPKFEFDLNVMKPLLRFGIPFQFNILLPALLTMPFTATLSNILGLSSYGFYNWALALASIPAMLSAIINKVAFPAYARLQEHPEELGQYVGTASRRIGAILFTIFSFATICCPPFIPVIFDPKWTPAIPLVQWMILEFVLSSLTGNLAAVQNAVGRPMERTWITLIMGLVRWGLVFVVARTFGLAGVGPLAMFLPTCIELVVTTYLVHRHNSGCKNLFRDIFEPIIATGIVLIASFGIGHLLMPNHVWGQWAISSACFIVLTAVREFFTPFSVIRSEIPGILKLLGRK